MTSVVIAGLEKVNPAVAYQINDTVFFGEPSGPCAGRQVLERFRLPYPGERISEDSLDEIECSQGCGSVCADPITQVLKELRLEDSLPLASGQG